MFSRNRFSGRRYADYRCQLKDRRRGAGRSSRPSGAGAAPVPPAGVAPHPRGGPRRRSFLALFLEFTGLVRGYHLTIALALVALTLSAVLGLIPLYGTKLIFDNVLAEQPLPVALPGWVPVPEDRRVLLTWIVTTMIVLVAASLAFSVWSRWQTTRITKRVQISVRKRAFNHAARLPLHRVYELKSGGVASILREDAGGVAELIFAMMYNPWRAIIQLTGSLIILAFVDARLLLGALVLLPTIYMTHRTWISRIRPLHRDIRASRQHIDSQATETFGGMRVVRGFGRQRSETGQFVRDNDFMVRQELHAWWWMRGVDIAWSILIPLASAVLLWYGGLRILEDRAAVAAGTLAAQDALTVGKLVMFLSYLVALLSPLETLANSATTLQNSLAGLDRVLDLLEEPAEMPASAGALSIVKQADGTRVFAAPTEPEGEAGSRSSGDGVHIHDPARFPPADTDGDGFPEAAGRQPVARRDERPESQGFRSRLPQSQLVLGRITIRNMSFTYPRTHQPVLQDINLDVQPGEVVAFIGPSGAGKTTLCNLIARFYDPTEGVIELDGVDLRHIRVDSYRGLLGIVEQDTFLFDGTVSENIGYGRHSATPDEIRGAARLANAHEFIERLKDGYATLIGERGVKLSGGQRQRLSIARAILADPRILILDEATSNLDTESERLIQHSLQTLMSGRTTFIIAHRLSTIVHADRIVVLESGRIVEAGRHSELLDRSGRYRTMLEQQIRRPEPLDEPLHRQPIALARTDGEHG